MGAQFSQTTRSLASDASRGAVLTWLLAAVLLGAWAVWFVFGSVAVYEISKRARLEVKQASHPVSALIASKIVSTSLAIGAQVRAGDVLVELEASSEMLRLREEEGRLAAIPRRIASLYREIEAHGRAKADDLSSAAASSEAAVHRNREANAALEFAKDHERRIAQLSATGGVARVEAIRAITDVEKLTASRDALGADIKRIQTDAQSRAHQNDAQVESLRQSIATLEGDLATTEATVERLNIDVEKHRVRSPITGRIGDVVPLPVGAYVAEGQRLATVVPNGDFIIAADFSPSLTLGRVRPGQHAQLRLDGFNWAQYGAISATVSRVASEVRDEFVRVEFTPDPDSAGRVTLQHGLPGSVEVIVEEASPATLVLRSAGLLLSAPRGQAVAEPIR